MIKLKITIILLFILQSCTPIIGIIGVASIGSVAKEKGIGTSITDGIIKSKISNKIFSWNQDAHGKTTLSVDNGSVLITGKTKNSQNKIQITRLAWEIKGVKEVNNELQISDISNIKNIARDIASRAEIRARIMADKRINSLNFSLDVVNDKAYLSGLAKSKEEMKLVKDYASSSRFVSEVFNYITINSDIR